MKKIVVKVVLKFVILDIIVGVGSGLIVNCFIDELVLMKDEIKGVVVVLKVLEDCLCVLGIEVFSVNDVVELDVYIDGVDEIIL